MGCLLHPRNLILSLIFTEVHDSPTFTVDCSIYLIWTLFRLWIYGLLDWIHWLFLWRLPFAWSWHFDFTDSWVWNGAHGGCDRSVGDVFSSSRYFIPPLASISRCPCLPHAEIYISFRKYETDEWLLFMLFHVEIPLWGSGLE
jgi:hypothetical protein